MTDIPTLAAQRWQEATRRALDEHRGKHYSLIQDEAGKALVEQAHHLATEAIAHPERAAEILKPMILVKPVDEAMEEAGRILDAWYKTNLTLKEHLARSIRLYRQREGGSHAG